MFSSSSAQWCSVNTTPSRGSARQLRRFTRVWHLEPARERFRRWMKTRVACPPYQVECSCQTTKALSLSRAPYTLHMHSNLTNTVALGVLAVGQREDDLKSEHNCTHPNPSPCDNTVNSNTNDIDTQQRQVCQTDGVCAHANVCKPKCQQFYRHAYT